ncbi:hypothetical protein [Herbaspirillum sp. RV1423]|uniref:hypothetical protein n=1 Tax=Herbaspirillum sp. RV1423 TaxID=1443993 RepID=UPI0004B999C5|nr:hypothetical protein [Herbaspirillum sp. RV1423]
MSKGDENFRKLEEWISSHYNPDGSLKLDGDGNPDPSNIKLNNNEGTINRTWLARHLGIYDRSALKTERARKSLKEFESALGIVSPDGARKPPQTASKTELERVKAEKDKLASRLLQVSAELKATQKEVKQKNKQLDQYAEIRRIQIETGRNLPGLTISFAGSDE